MTGAVVTSGQSMYVYDRGVVQNGIVSVGTAFISSGGTAVSCGVESGAKMYVSSGAFASGVTANSAGSAWYYNGATALDPVVSGGGWVSIQTTASGLAMDGGTVYFQNTAGKVLQGATLNSGTFYGYAGNVADATIYTATVLLLSSGSATNANVAGTGYLQLRAGTVASGVTVVSKGHLVVSSGGTALAVTSNTGALITVQAGGYIEYA